MDVKLALPRRHSEFSRQQCGRRDDACWWCHLRQGDLCRQQAQGNKASSTNTTSFRNLSEACCVGTRTKEKPSKTSWRRRRGRSKEPGERDRQPELAVAGTREQGERVKERWDFRGICEGLKQWKQLRNKKQNRESLQSAWYNVCRCGAPWRWKSLMINMLPHGLAHTCRAIEEEQDNDREERILAILGIVGTILNLLVVIFVYIYTTI
ncbi:uncharacterized protein LOC117597583 [Pangasianodon hypophthalmus]|uniref:uncharacterized protein LOC117597583 n=1 Tax=Pangasianodon hypophthalmus TaxID=310915 RepID=UPI002307A566|nr:uncharacterized protein LOC117597583 [Pangasianodon hypophthalmus]